MALRIPDMTTRTFIRSFRHALRGLRFAWRVETNFRIQLLVAIAAILLALVLRISTLEFLFVLLLVVLVLVLELLNTFFEKLIDLVNPRVHEYVRQLKDVLAGAVLVASVGSFIAGVLIFGPHLVRLWID